jgi:hypothetical protein
MWKSFVLELHGEWSEFADECFALNASTQRALWYIEVLQFRLHPVRGKGRSHLYQPASTDS